MKCQWGGLYKNYVILGYDITYSMKKSCILLESFLYKIIKLITYLKKKKNCVIEYLNIKLSDVIVYYTARILLLLLL